MCGLLLALLCCFAAAGCKPKGPDADAGKAPDAWIVKPIYRDVEEYEDFTGKTISESSVEVKPRATGHLEKINFKDGEMVKQGDVLFEIDPREYRAALDKAKASLTQAEVRMRRLESDHRRGLELVSGRTMSQEQFDQITSDLGEARAKVKVEEANKQTAEYNLDWCKVTAKISGKISSRVVDVGNIVEKDKTVLSNIVSLDPMYARFDIDERTVLRLQKNVKNGKLLLSQEQKLKFKIGLADETGYSLDGIADFVDNKIDTGTGTLRVRGTFDNTQLVAGTWPWERPTNYRLPPGLFVRIRLPVGEPRQRLLIPEKAVLTDQDKKFIYVVTEKKTIESRSITLGTLQEDQMRVIDSGLNYGEMVVVKGLQRIRPKLPDGSPMVVEPREDPAWKR